MSLETIRAFPKIFQIGTKYIDKIFNGEVEITEKIDGSAFSFGIINGELQVRSKGKVMNVDAPEKMFTLAVEYVKKLVQDKAMIAPGFIYHCEYLSKPKHNVLTYSRVPKNNLILYGVENFEEKSFTDVYEVLFVLANRLKIEVVPLLFRGKIKDKEELIKLLDTNSVLGNSKIEGLVVKNYSESILIGGQVIPVMMGKYVSEKFKEVHNKHWKKENTGKGKFETLKESYKTEARWQKAVQHLRDIGKLDNSPKDIGILMKEIESDIIQEEKEVIKDKLWNIFGDEILRYSLNGFPNWYKEQLLNGAIQ